MEAPKEYCCHKSCNLSFGSAEPRVAVGLGKVMHKHCYVKHLRESRKPALQLPLRFDEAGLWRIH